MNTIKIAPPQHLIDADISIPGSKSYTNRALILSALAEGKTILRNFSPSDDSRALVSGLRNLGVQISDPDQNFVVTVTGAGGKFHPFHGEINVGPAGTAMRFLTSFCAIADGSEIVLSGSERMHERPISDLVSALRTLGAEIEYLGKDGCPPLRIHGRKLHSQKIQLSGRASSQFLTSILMMAPTLTEGLEIEILGDLVSSSYAQMTFDAMRDFGVSVSNDHFKKFIVSPGSRYRVCDYFIESDLSGASYFWALAAVSGGRVRISNLNPHSAQGDIAFPSFLQKMGCEVSIGSDFIEVRGTQDLRGIEANMELCPDTAQTLTVVAAFASGPTRITGLSTLKKKETDRIFALKTELGKMGISSETGDDFIVIHGGNPHSAEIATYEDHRMAMAFGVAGVRVPMIIQNPEVVGKSFPDFWERMKEVGVKI